MKFVYREIDGKIQAVQVSGSPRLPNRTNALFGENVPFHQRILNGYADLEAKGEYRKSARVKTFVRDVHVRALEEGF